MLPGLSMLASAHPSSPLHDPSSLPSVSISPANGRRDLPCPHRYRRVREASSRGRWPRWPPPPCTPRSGPSVVPSRRPQRQRAKSQLLGPCAELLRLGQQPPLRCPPLPAAPRPVSHPTGDARACSDLGRPCVPVLLFRRPTAARLPSASGPVSRSWQGRLPHSALPGTGRGTADQAPEGAARRLAWPRPGP